MEYTVLGLAFAWLTGLAFATALVGTWIARSRRSTPDLQKGPGGVLVRRRPKIGTSD
jgi:hypothetical protein